MILFEIYQQGGYKYNRRFIIAPDRKSAIKKYVTIEPVDGSFPIATNEICSRDEIVPTIEPQKEFSHLIS